MDLSNFNMSTVFMIALAIIFAYIAIRFFDKVICRIISISIGIALLLLILNQLGITIPIISNLFEIIFNAFKAGIYSVKKIL